MDLAFFFYSLRRFETWETTSLTSKNMKESKITVPMVWDNFGYDWLQSIIVAKKHKGFHPVSTSTLGKAMQISDFQSLLVWMV
jgi:hypothetical protein